MEFRKMLMITLYAKQKKRHRCTEQTFGLCGRRRGWDVSREQHVYYLQRNRSPAQVGCMRQVLGPGALGRPRGIGWRGRWERGSGWGTHVNLWLIHVNVWQNPLQYCKIISLQLIKKKKNSTFFKTSCHFMGRVMVNRMWEKQLLCNWLDFVTEKSIMIDFPRILGSEFASLVFREILLV